MKRQPKMARTTPYTLEELKRCGYKRTTEAVNRLSPDELAELRRVQEEEAAALQKRFPAGRKFYSYTLPNDSTWRRLEECPDAETLDRLEAMRWGDQFIHSAARTLGSFVITGVHHNSRVIEFEYVHELQSNGDTKLYAPFA